MPKDKAAQKEIRKKGKKGGKGYQLSLDLTVLKNDEDEPMAEFGADFYDLDYENYH